MASNKIMLTSSDGECFEVEEAVAQKFQIVAHMMEDKCVINEIPLRNVTGPILAMVIEYCKKHLDHDSTEGNKDEAEKKELELKTWDEEFMKNLDQPTIFQVILAANYLNVKDLLDLACQTVADYIKDKSVEDVREIFNIENDYTHEEEENLQKENAWAFESDAKP